MADTVKSIWSIHDEEQVLEALQGRGDEQFLAEVETFLKNLPKGLVAQVLGVDPHHLPRIHYLNTRSTQTVIILKPLNQADIDAIK